MSLCERSRRRRQPPLCAGVPSCRSRKDHVLTVALLGTGLIGRPLREPCPPDIAFFTGLAAALGDGYGLVGPHLPSSGSPGAWLLRRRTDA
ncbi:MAG: hypothetical protein Q605_AUC01001G0002 [Actinomyces urogenitalis DORA_12]|uniref:Uncharacterized protein n=1 Tax=Actinomyces urogenitalis DORA_12 TaxID=1403939 RepID=W1V879_9ACTO|nr:MAG: hypothetical protein Q605_AUC01001G0002 [Actinomyces urogenitalis DORA_12]